MNGSERTFLSLGSGLRWLIWLVASARQHRRMILDRADMTWVIWPVLDGCFEDDSLVVALALALGFDAVGTSRSLLAAFDAAFPTSEAACLGSFPHLVD
jgi:hypothetical protein